MGDHESQMQYCMSFMEFKKKRWNPLVFGWPDGTRMNVINMIIKDPEYQTRYAVITHKAGDYGPPPFKIANTEVGPVRGARVQLIVHWKILRNAVPNFSLENLDQLVEFGGGTGELAVMLREWGYKGTHFVLDMPAMLLMQRYFHRIAGFPTFLGQGLKPSPDAVRGNTILADPLNKVWAAHIDQKQDKTSMFIATWSFTEADVHTRDVVKKEISKFGYILLVFWNAWDGINNYHYLLKWIEEYLNKSHNILSWKAPIDRKSYYLVAVRRDIGKVVCNAENGCAAAVLHPAIRKATNPTR